MTDINPRVDIAFKKIFGVEENKDLLISLINSIVSKADQVRDVKLLSPYNPRNFREAKLSILDIKAESETGKRFNIEMQVISEENYEQRALFYWGKNYTDQLKSGESYSKLCKTIGIHILNFTSLIESPKYHNTFCLTEKELGLTYFHDIEIHTIELNKFPISDDEELKTLLQKVKNTLDIWTTFLIRHDLLKEDALPKEFKAVNLKKALDVLKVLNFNPSEREAYEAHLNWLRLEGDAVKMAVKRAEERAEEEGMKRGMEKGMERGMKRGMKRGMEKGMEKGMKQVAKNMLAAGLPIEQIVQITGLTKEEILP